MIKDILFAGADSGGTPGPTPDPLYSSVELLVTMDEEIGDPILDYSKNSWPLTAVGGITTTDTALFAGKNTVNISAGYGWYLEMSNALSPKLGTGPFTIEVFLKTDSTAATTGMIDGRLAVDTVNYLIGVNSNLFLVQATGTNAGFSYTETGNFVHLALVRDEDGIGRGFVGGEFISTIILPPDMDHLGTLRLGRALQGNAAPNTYMAGVRITKGVARYSSSFSPPTTRFWRP